MNTNTASIVTKASRSQNRAQHTPGPWFVEKSYSESEGNFVAVWHENPGEKFWQRIVKMHDYKSSAEANARLIAAAPDLLNELVKTNLFLVHIVSCIATTEPAKGLLQGHIELNKAAIAAAEGSAQP